ncbi:PREDICTED: membrane protein of ER body-like protein isoform X1 [Populus euphratica]|uniref:Membrane protein of ER body-like protein isoform X1 n=1 Tax=Populus euphratica TaxID=75702 RepID=A0AAJ6X2H6_POPEU|nr:PREDICTED: membrane protein of ER body-like protein isoform X1 [Populus euphratica]
MASPTHSLANKIPMERQEHKLMLEEEEEEEVMSLQTRQFRHSSTATDTTTLLANISSTNDDGNGNGNGISSLISSSSNSSINDHSETPKGVSSPCGSPHKHSGDEERVHHLDSVYFDQHQGADSIDGVSAVKCGGVTCSVFETSPGDVEVLIKNSEIQKSLIKDVNLQSRENLDNEGLSSSSLTPLEGTFEEHNIKSKPSDSETRVVGDLDLIEEIDQEMTEFDVEKVLEKQNTHDLYCPNCNSCITRRVILRRRTRKIHKAPRKPKHTKADSVLPSQSDANSAYSDASSADSANGPSHDIANIGSNDIPTPAVDEYNGDRQPDVFRCLSCFSFFIPAGNCFKLFRVSSTENENEQVPPKIATTNTNWFLSIFATHKRKTTTEQGNAAVGPTQVCGMKRDTSSGFHNNVSSSNGSNHSVMRHAERTTVKTGEHAEGSYSKPHQSETKSLNPSTMEPLLHDKSPQGINLNSNLTTRNGILADQNSPLFSIDLPPVESSSIAGLDDMGGTSLKDGMAIVISSRETKFAETKLNSAREISGDAAENSGGSSVNHAIVDTVQQLPYSSGSIEGLKENASLEAWQGGVNRPEYSTSISLILEQSQIRIEENFNMAKGNEKPLQNGQASSTQGTSLPSQLFSKEGFINDAALEYYEVGKGALNSLSQGTSRPEKERVNIGEDAVNSVKNKNIGNDVIVTIEKEPPKRGDSEIVCIDSVEPTSLLNSTNMTNMVEQRDAGVGESRQWEIIKSIVYGGLIESITSLSVVSSAAGAGAANLNIIALGLANLIGGLFILGHNLVDLKNDRSNQVNEQEDRYQETLGRRDNFSLHATLSILSFLIFGLLPPVMYGFLFRKSDDGDLKLAAVGGASLFCIILLAVGKAHIQRKQPKPYISTALYFFSIGLMASGASFIAGDLISKLLQKISGFESNLLQVLKPSEPATWASY